MGGNESSVVSGVSATTQTKKNFSLFLALWDAHSSCDRRAGEKRRFLSSVEAGIRDGGRHGAGTAQERPSIVLFSSFGMRWHSRRARSALALLTMAGLFFAGDAWSEKLAKPDFTVYHTMEATLASVAHIVDSSTHLFVEKLTREAGRERDGQRLQPIDTERNAEGPAGSGETSYKTEMQVVTYDEGRTNEEAAYRVLIDFGEHGREVITTEVGMAFLAALASPATRDRILSKFDVPNYVSSELTEILSRTIIKVIPIENTNGRTKVESGELCERKNGRGVDPNRNWGVDWGKKEADYDPSEEYPGEFPFSEPEAQLLRDIAQQFRPDMFLNIHSGMEAMFVPWDHRLDIDYGVNVNATLDMFNEINSKFCSNKCAVGSGGKQVGYLAHGTVTDYMHEVLNVPISSTWEIYGDLKADFNDCWRMFNPIGVESKDSVVDRWVGSLFYAIWFGLGERHPVGRGKRVRERLDNDMENGAIDTGGDQMLVVYALLVPVIAAIVIGARNMRVRRRRRAGDQRLPV